MTAPPWSDLVFVRLHWGRDRAITIGDLAEQMGVHRSIIEHAIEDLRANGSPICSASTGKRGIWLTNDADELMEMYRTLRRRAIGQLRNARRLRVTAEAFRRQGQMRLAL